MTTTLRITLIVASILVFLFVIHKIRKSQLQITDAIIWIIGTLTLVIISIFSSIMEYLAELVGVYSTVNFVFLVFIFFLLIIVFNLSIKISQLNEKIKNLNHYIAISEHKDTKK